MIDKALVALLRQHSTLAPDRIQPSTETVKVTENLPRLAYSLIDIKREHCDDGPIGLPVARYQLDIFAPQQWQARQIADAFRNGVDGFKGTISDVTILHLWMGDENFAKGEKLPGVNNTIARQVCEVFVTYRD